MKKIIFLFLLLDFLNGWAESNSQKSNLRFPFDLPKGEGPWIRPSIGQIWPQPQLQQVYLKNKTVCVKLLSN